MITLAPWDALAYQRIASVALQGDHLAVRFDDGSWATVEVQRLLPPGSGHPDWTSITSDVYEIVVPTDRGDVEIPWTTIRALTDAAFAAHLATVAEEQSRLVGTRLRALRHRRKLTAREVAERAGITPQSLSRIENGRHDVVLTTLQRILAAMGYSLRDIAESQEQAAKSS
jgi:DNA-binding XRE family transcriptional regulator